MQKLVVENVEVLTQMRTSFDKPEAMAALFKKLTCEYLASLPASAPFSCATTSSPVPPCRVTVSCVAQMAETVDWLSYSGA